MPLHGYTGRRFTQITTTVIIISRFIIVTYDFLLSCKNISPASTGPVVGRTVTTWLERYGEGFTRGYGSGSNYEPGSATVMDNSPVLRVWVW